MPNTIPWAEMIDRMERWEQQPWFKKLPLNTQRFVRKNILRGPKRLKNYAIHAKQRVRKGYSYLDVWGLDHYIRRITIDGLRELADQAHGWPGDEYMTFDEYIAMIREIADAFEMDLNASENWRLLTAQEELRLDDAWNNYRHWYWSFWD